MATEKQRVRMRAALGEGIGPIARALIAIAGEKDDVPHGDMPHRTASAINRFYMPAYGEQIGLPDRIRFRRVRSFIDSRPPKERAALAALLLLGREPLGTTAADIEAVVEEFTARQDIGLHLAGKDHLARYLETALETLGI